MNEYDDETVWAVAKALHPYMYTTSFNQLGGNDKMELYEMAERALRAIPTETQRGWTEQQVQAATDTLFDNLNGVTWEGSEKEYEAALTRAAAELNAFGIASPATPDVNRTTTHSNEEILAGARELWENLYDITWEDATDIDKENTIELVERVLKSKDQADESPMDEDIVHWTRGEVTLEKALRYVPNSQPVTLTMSAYAASKIGDDVIESAEWKYPVPERAKTGLPLVIAVDEVFLVLGEDKFYHRYFMPVDAFKETANDVDARARETGNSVKVVIDADGLRVK